MTQRLNMEAPKEGMCVTQTRGDINVSDRNEETTGNGFI